MLVELDNRTRAVGNTIYYWEGKSRNKVRMIHELTHVWRYQNMGVVYAPRGINAQINEGYDYSEADMSKEETLIDVRSNGNTLYDFNLEQQGRFSKTTSRD